MSFRRGGVALGTIALVAAIASGSRALGVVGVGFLLAGGVTWLWAWLVDSPVHVVHKVDPSPAVEGDAVRVALGVRRRSRVPLGSMTVRLTVGRLGACSCRMRGHGRLAKGGINLGPLPRGVFALSDPRVVFGDLLGLVTVTPRVECESATVVVRPRLTALDGLFSDAGRAAGDGRSVLLRRAAGFDFHSVREYEQGESLRRVHWPSSARRGQLMVKELEDTAHDAVVVILDCDPRYAVGDPPESSFDAAVRVAGSLLQAHAVRGRAATLVSTGRTRAVRSRALGGGRSRRRRDLARSRRAGRPRRSRTVPRRRSFVGVERRAGRGHRDNRCERVRRGARSRHPTPRLGRLDRRGKLRRAPDTRRARPAPPRRPRCSDRGGQAGDDLAAVLSARSFEAVARA